jgi:predicted DCC family thiol-disulfide oxidoreductase YuxK
MADIGNDPLLLYDGVCGFCNKSVQTILAHDRRGTMKFAPLQSELGKSLLAKHDLQGIDALVFVDRSQIPERVYVRSGSALKVAEYLGGWWKGFLIFTLVPRPIRDFFYNLFARYRYRFFGKYDSCMLPAPETRARFLDMA